MDYSKYCYAKETAKEIGGGVFKVFRWIIHFIIKLCRSILYLISSIGVLVFGWTLPFGVYFGYNVARQMLNGVPFFEAKNWGMFLFAFGFPFTFMVIRAITKPRE